MNAKEPTDADFRSQNSDAKSGTQNGERTRERANERSSGFLESNPFSSRFTAPGKIPFFFERAFLRRMKAARPAKFEEFFVRALGAGEDIRTSVCLQFLIDQFETNSRRGQLVGPHGTGKSTLLFALKEALIKRGYEVFSWELHDQRRFLPDVFWLELQRFLQSTPAFLPTKCLLPPPVVSRKEYWARRKQNRAEVDFSPQKSEGDVESFDDVSTFDEFNVDSLSKTLESSSESRQADRPPRRSEGFFGFNAAGNFGFNAVGYKRDEVAPAVSEDDATNRRADVDDAVPVAPFPGVAPSNENESENAESSDSNAFSAPESRAASSLRPSTSEPAARQAALDVPFAQKKLEIPLPLGFDLAKSRSLFEKKVVFFDGFEQLSYVNRIVLRTFCRMNRLGLLLTTHSPAIGVPVLYRTIPSVETLRQTLNFLLDDLDMTPDDADLEILLKNFNGDIREIIFSLYDAFENYRWAPRELRQKIARRYPR